MAAKQVRTFINAAHKADSERAATLVNDAASENGIKYVFSMPVLPAHWEIAHATGLARTLIKKLRGRLEGEDRGDDDERIDTEGCLAELLVSLALERSGAEIAPLVAHKPDSSGLDVKSGGKRLDVKSISQARDCICINHQTHTRKKPDAYILVHLIRADTADVYVVSSAAVSSWYLATTLKKRPIPPRRFFYIKTMPAVLEPLPPETEDMDVDAS